jgi:hypothetical protein
VARLGRTLLAPEAARIEALLDDGSAHIRRYCRRSFTELKDDTLELRADNGVIKLPGRPISSVKSVTAIGIAPGVPDIGIFWFVFDGIDEIAVPEPIQSGIINLPAIWYDLDWFSTTFRVVFSHGDSATPPEVVAVLCSAVISELVSPTQASGLASETVGAYSYSMRRASGGIKAALTDAGMELSLSDFRTKTGTISVRP